MFKNISISDVASILEEKQSALHLPLSYTNLQDVKNPFTIRDINSITDYELDSVSIPSTYNYSDSIKSSNGITSTNRIKTEKNEDKKEIYQLKLTPEIETNFKQLKLLGKNDESWISRRKVKLKPQINKKKTLILDLDGTLISYKGNLSNLSESRFNLKSLSIKDIMIRPHTFDLLNELKEYYEIIVFSSGICPYVNFIVNHLDPKKLYIEYVLHRLHCVMENDFMIKDLRVIGNRSLNDIIIIDNSILSFAWNMDNGIYIPTYQGDCEDCELLKISEFLKRIVNVDDVRPYIKEFSGTYYTR